MKKFNWTEVEKDFAKLANKHFGIKNPKPTFTNLDIQNIDLSDLQNFMHEVYAMGYNDAYGEVAIETYPITKRGGFRSHTDAMENAKLTGIDAE